MPLPFAFIFRVAIMLLLAAHVFYMYCTARGMSETFGFNAAATAVACLFALAMLIPLVWAVALPEIPEAISQHVLPRRRWKQGRCPHCGYDTRQQSQSSSNSIQRAICSECGGELREPSPWRVGRRTIQRFVAINLIAWLVGCVVGEVWMQIDEREFARSVEQRLLAGNTTPFSRARHWPDGSCSLVYTYPDGIHATE